MNKIKSFSVFTLTNFLYSFSQWVILIIILKFIGIESMGLYSIGLAISAPIVLMTTFGSSVLLITNNTYNFSNYFYNKLMIQALIYLIVMGLLIFIYLDNIYSLSIILLVILLKFSTSFIDLFFEENIAKKKHNSVAAYKVLISFSYILINIASIYFFQSLLTAIIISILFNIVFILIFIKSHLHSMSINLRETLNLILLGLPISLTLFLSSLNTNIPKYGLEIFENSYYVGIFTSLLLFYSIGNQMFFSINNFVLPYIKDYKNDKKMIQRIFKLIMILPIIFFIPFILIFYFFVEYIIVLFFSEELLKYKNEMMVVVIMSIFIYYSILFDTFINLKEKYKFNTVVQLSSVVIVSISTVLFIGSMGILGAIFTFGIYCFTVFFLKLIYSYFLIYRSN